FDRYFSDVEDTILGLAELAKEAANGEPSTSNELLAHHVLYSAWEVFELLTDKLARRISEKFGDARITDRRSSYIALSEEDVKDFENAVGPVCSLLAFTSGHDFNSERILLHVGSAGKLLHSVVMEGLSS